MPKTFFSCVPLSVLTPVLCWCQYNLALARALLWLRLQEGVIVGERKENVEQFNGSSHAPPSPAVDEVHRQVVGQEVKKAPNVPAVDQHGKTAKARKFEALGVGQPFA